MSGTMGSVARARTGRDDRGRLCVFGSARAPDGQRLRKRLVVPEDDAALAAETIRELNRRFALGDLSWFEESPHRSPSPKRRRERQPSRTGRSDGSTEARGEIGEHTWRTYRTEARALSAALRRTAAGSNHRRRSDRTAARSEAPGSLGANDPQPPRLPAPPVPRCAPRRPRRIGPVRRAAPAPADQARPPAGPEQAHHLPAPSSPRSWSVCSRSYAARATRRSGCGSR
jgi:hypothetical protein